MCPCFGDIVETDFGIKLNDGSGLTMSCHLLRTAFFHYLSAIAKNRPVGRDQTIDFAWLGGSLSLQSYCCSCWGAEHGSPTARLDHVKADPTDNRILEGDVAAGSEVSAGGDRHLLEVVFNDI